MFGEQAAKILEAVTVFSQNNLPELLDQFLNYMLFHNIMLALRAIIALFITWIIVKTLNAVIRVYKEEKNIMAVTLLDFTRACVIGAALCISIVMAWTPTLTVAKIIIAPKVFLLEEGAAFLKNQKQP